MSVREEIANKREWLFKKLRKPSGLTCHESVINHFRVDICSLGNQGEDCEKYPHTFHKTKQLICGHKLRFLCSSLFRRHFRSLSCEVLIKCNSLVKMRHVCKGAMLPMLR